MLYSMTNELKVVTAQSAKEILEFICDYRKYFGKIFVFEGTVSEKCLNFVFV